MGYVDTSILCGVYYGQGFQSNCISLDILNSQLLNKVVKFFIKNHLIPHQTHLIPSFFTYNCHFYSISSQFVITSTFVSFSTLQQIF